MKYYMDNVRRGRKQAVKYSRKGEYVTYHGRRYYLDEFMQSQYDACHYDDIPSDVFAVGSIPESAFSGIVLELVKDDTSYDNLARVVYTWG